MFSQGRSKKQRQAPSRTRLGPPRSPRWSQSIESYHVRISTMSPMARLAWFSPMPPARSGVAVYSADIVERLRGSHEVHVFVDEPVARVAGAAGIPRAQIRSAHDFVWLQQLNP